MVIQPSLFWPYIHNSMSHNSRCFGFQWGFTPLHLASQSGHEGLVRLLLNYPGIQADATTHMQVKTEKNCYLYVGCLN